MENDRANEAPARDMDSRGTMMKMYSKKEASERKKIITPGYFGEQAVQGMQVYYSKFKNVDRQMEYDPNGYSACTSYLS